MIDEGPMFDVDDEVLEQLHAREPDAIMHTGNTTGVVAAELHVYRHGGNTYVMTVGEAQNAEPYMFRGEPAYTDILEEYKEAVREVAEDDGPFYDDVPQ